MESVALVVVSVFGFVFGWRWLVRLFRSGTEV